MEFSVSRSLALPSTRDGKQVGTQMSTIKRDKTGQEAESQTDKKLLTRHEKTEEA